MKAYFTVGVSASGKSTWSAKLREKKHVVEINRDDYRREILTKDGVYQPGNLWLKWNFKREKEVSALADSDLQVAVENKYDVVFSNTNLNPDRLSSDIQKMKNLGFETEVIYFPVADIDVVIERDRKRLESVGEKVLRQQWKQWLCFGPEVTGIKTYVKNEFAPKAIVVDIDGTVAKMKGRGPFEWNRVDLDEPRDEVLMMIRSMKNTFPNLQVIFLSGRDSVCRDLTEKWLDEYYSLDGAFDSDWLLYMRKENDMRKDRLVKDELFFEFVAPYYNVLFAVDDRRQMVHYWNDIGVSLFNVGNPYDDF